MQTFEAQSLVGGPGPLSALALLASGSLCACSRVRRKKGHNATCGFPLVAEHSTHSGDTHDGREGQKDPRLSLGFRVRACPVSAKIPHGAKDFPFHNGHLEVWRDVSAAGKEVGCGLLASGT